jgi:hypothetical protein
MPDKIILSRRITALKLTDNRTGGKPYRKTEVYASAADRKLFFRFDLEEKFFSPFGKRYNDALWQGDVAEIMLTLGDKNRYLEIEINPDGFEYAALVQNDGAGKFTLEFLDRPPFTSAALRTEKGWECTVILPFGLLKMLGWEPKNSFINLYREDFTEEGEMELSALNPTLGGSFHRPEFFVPLEITEE